MPLLDGTLHPGQNCFRIERFGYIVIGTVLNCGCCLQGPVNCRHDDDIEVFVAPPDLLEGLHSAHFRH